MPAYLTRGFQEKSMRDKNQANNLMILEKQKKKKEKWKEPHSQLYI